jgi:hypothetical protein
MRIEAVPDPLGVQAMLDDWLRALDSVPAAVLFEAELGRMRVPASVEAVELALGCPCWTGALV